MGTNLLIGGTGGNPALHVAKECTLTISGYSSLEARDYHLGDGIGCGENSPYKECGNIVIKSGHIEAYATTHAAGISSCQTGTCGDITIEGGEVYSYGAEYGAGIGGGNYSKCQKITINNGRLLLALCQTTQVTAETSIVEHQLAFVAESAAIHVFRHFCHNTTIF